MKYFYIFFIFLTISCSNNTGNNCDDSCTNFEICKKEECILMEGACYNASECQQSEICDTNTNQCVNNPCNSWEEYQNENCVLRQGACNDNNDCNIGENCINHKCTTIPADCTGITCSNHGTCQIAINVAICNCDLGYQDNDDNLTCEPDCNSVNNCGVNATSCDDSTGIAVCNCANNYYGNSQYECVSPCENITCNNGICIADGVTESHCQCNTGYHDYNDLCLADPIKVSVGNYFTCSLLSDKTIVCFGDNKLGQLGNGTTNNISNFNLTAVSDIDNATDIITGNEHACALLEDKTVKCWGNNQYGQLGNGNFENSNSPVTVKDLANVISLKAGAYHNCALLADGKVKCWGMNLYAQLGNRELINKNKPVYIVKDFTLTPLEDISFIGVGGLHNCLQQTNGDIWCWGSNSNGQLGNNKDWHNYPSCRTENCRDAKEIQAINITQLARDENREIFNSVDDLILGGNFTLGLKGNDLYFWGESSMYQLAVENTDNQIIPPLSPQLTGYTNIQLGGTQTCGIKDSKLYCLGRNLFGELGDINIIEKTYTMTEIINLDNLSQYSLGTNHNCAIVDTKIKCWGSNIRGELGIDNEIIKNSTTVVDVLGF